MANGKTEAKTEPTTAVATLNPNALAPMPDYAKTGTRHGLEDTTQDDMMIPRLALAQPLSPQVTEGDPRQIKGLKAGDLFNSVTGEPYGREVSIQVLRKMPKRAMEFNPIEDGGGVRDPNVPLDDPRTRFGADGSKPVATLFRDFIALVLPANGIGGGEVIALSFKSSGLKAAKTLWGMVAFRNADCFAGKYKITTGMKLDPKPHWIYKVDNDGWVDEVQFNYGRQMAEAAAGLNAEQVHREAEADPEESFVDAAGSDRVNADM